MADKKKSNLFAAVGAATGLGNAFRFPALCVSYGAAFVFAYGAALALVCFPLLCAELHFGRRAGNARRAKLWAFIMRVAAANSALIALYYAVIASKLGSACLSFACFATSEADLSTAFFIVTAVLITAVVFILLRGGQRALAVSGRLSVGLSLALLGFLAVKGIVRGGAFSSLDFSSLLGGSIWADALGQALLALSLAAGVMPSFARAQGSEFSVPRTAFIIVAANFAGCLLALFSTLPFVSYFPQTDGINCALTVYPQVVAAVAKSRVGARVFGTLVYAVLTVVAVHSLASLATPAITVVRKKYKYAPAIFCLASALLLPLFSSFGLQVLSACDRAACSVSAILIAFAECVFFASQRDIKGANKLFMRFLCPLACGSLALFSLCSARFGCFAPFAAACAFVAMAAVWACGALPQLTYFIKRAKILRKIKLPYEEDA
ncbi:MAG: hypothetical protein K2G26_03680 [Clostridia bacterium]|nr:hypothetical protein [Clostridia bacterium]